ncbi:MAG: trypsin-like peptidase domain-containing protein [Defluviimonas sp.]|nr:trypsin-like peptidase domain-containing protein [Defluviimonas sp.]
MRRAGVWPCVAVAVVVGTLVSVRGASAQEAYVQIEAQPSLAAAEDRLRAYSGLFPEVAGFAMDTGWYAIALGPFTPEEAERQLALLRGERMIPADSYLADTRRFRRQFWPVGAAAALGGAALPGTALPGTALPDTRLSAAALPPAEAAAAAAPAPLLVEPEETLQQARAGEAALTGEERQLLQTALQWQGFYSAAIDGAFGPGTRASMAAWQAAAGHEPTGVLTTRQREELVAAYRAEQAALGLGTVTDTEAGIEVTLPTALVEFSRYEPPFVHYAEKDGSGVQVILISQQGDAATLAGLYELLQTLEAIPLEGPRALGRTSFTIEGSSPSRQSHAQAELRGGLIKGFIVTWTPQNAGPMPRVVEAMKTSFRGIGERALDASLGVPSTQSAAALMAGLEVRRPALARTGFYLDGAGTVVTTAEVVASCSRITLDGGIEAAVAFLDEAAGVAVLRPAKRLAPPATAAFRSAPLRGGSEVAVAGFAYAEVLDAPVMTFGTLAEARGLNGEPELQRLALAALPGDAGGPVVDASGAVAGMLLPRATPGGRVLPADVSFALDGGTLATLLAENGFAPAPSTQAGAMAAEDLTDHSLKMTVLVSCWE